MTIPPVSFVNEEGEAWLDVRETYDTKHLGEHLFVRLRWRQGGYGRKARGFLHGMSRIPEMTPGWSRWSVVCSVACVRLSASVVFLAWWNIYIPLRDGRLLAQEGNPRSIMGGGNTGCRAFLAGHGALSIRGIWVRQMRSRSPCLRVCIKWSFA